MDIESILRKNEIKYKNIDSWGVYLRYKWEDSFCKSLNKEERENINMYADRYACGYLWHIFSYDKVEHLRGEKAIEAFEKKEKKEVYIFHQNNNKAYIVEDGSKLNYSDLEKDEFEDIYVVDKFFRWTFVKTHENGECGPYFFSE